MAFAQTTKAHLSSECKLRIAFLWQTQIQTTKYGLYDMIPTKKKEFILILLPFTPSDMNFKTILRPKVILAKKNCHKKATLILHS